MKPIEIYWISHFQMKNLGAKHVTVSADKYSMNRKGTFQITAITPAIFIPFWLDL